MWLFGWKGTFLAYTSSLRMPVRRPNPNRKYGHCMPRYLLCWEVFFSYWKDRFSRRKDDFSAQEKNPPFQPWKVDFSAEKASFQLTHHLLEFRFCTPQTTEYKYRVKGGGRAVHPPPPPAWAHFTLMMECTPESDCCYSVYSVPQTNVALWGGGGFCSICSLFCGSITCGTVST